MLYITAPLILLFCVWLSIHPSNNAAQI
uniref:Uncharacterized protein n=1 Tax=Rhizophora mucronata TaxID=61149 RepID=A0A2P2R370_RHIMU